jgi:hypothetical protein
MFAKSAISDMSFECKEAMSGRSGLSAIYIGETVCPCLLVAAVLIDAFPCIPAAKVIVPLLNSQQSRVTKDLNDFTNTEYINEIKNIFTVSFMETQERINEFHQIYTYYKIQDLFFLTSYARKSKQTEK